MLLAAAPAVPAAAQLQSKGYKFLQAVKDGKGSEVVDMLDKPGSDDRQHARRRPAAKARCTSSSSGATTCTCAICCRSGADPNLRDGRGNTPLMLAVQYGQTALVESLVASKANPNLGNASGETPLIRAVQRRDLAMVRALLAAKANPDQRDNDRRHVGARLCRARRPASPAIVQAARPRRPGGRRARSPDPKL